MPFNLLKSYNALLELLGMNLEQRKKSLHGVFKRDFESQIITFHNKQVDPTPQAGEDTLATLFRHLTTVIVDKKTKHREFELSRSERLHWVRHHLDEKKLENMYLFSVKEGKNKRTYYYDADEEYVIILEPLRSGEGYYLLTAYKLEGKDKERNKIMKKYKRRLPEVL